MPKKTLKTRVKEWFSKSANRHIASGLVVLTLQNVLIQHNVNSETAKQAAALIGQLLLGI